ncbi:hypothetical protein KAR91_49265 [Candidatus Pacearchaeota archaeon]|nr:hypothetical protein [Candidatus Pacearchaeota archaeon]
MSKINNEKQIDRIKKFALKWKWIVTELGWNFDMMYCDNYDDMPRETSDQRIAALIRPKFDYLTADIYFNLEIVNELEDDKLEEAIVHELTHMLLRPLVEAPELEEYTTTTISRILIRMKSSLD